MKILVLSVLAGFGHISAAEALAAALSTRCDDVKIADPIGGTFLSYFNNWLYVNLATFVPKLWGRIYKSKRLSAYAKPLLIKIYSRPCKKLLFQYKPDIVVSTHAFTTAAVAHLKHINAYAGKLVNVATDLDLHWLSADPMVDRYIVADQRQSEQLKNWGIEEDKIFVISLPVHPKFLQEKSKEDLLSKYNLCKDRINILISCGGYAIGKLAAVVKGLKDLNYDCNFLVVCGKARRLKVRLTRSIKKENFYIFGFVDAMDELMSIADLMVTKPGGITIAETLSKNLPLVLLPAVDGQEEYNALPLMREEAAVKVQNLRDIDKIICSLIKDGRLNSLREKMRAIKKPDPHKIAECICNVYV